MLNVTANAIVSQVRVIANSVHWYLFSISLDIVLECNMEDIDHPGPTTMNLQVFSPEKKTGEALILKKICRLLWKYYGSIKL